MFVHRKTQTIAKITSTALPVKWNNGYFRAKIVEFFYDFLFFYDFFGFFGDFLDFLVSFWIFLVIFGIFSDFWDFFGFLGFFLDFWDFFGFFGFFWGVYEDFFEWKTPRFIFLYRSCVFYKKRKNPNILPVNGMNRALMFRLITWCLAFLYLPLRNKYMRAKLVTIETAFHFQKKN